MKFGLNLVLGNFCLSLMWIIIYYRMPIGTRELYEQMIDFKIISYPFKVFIDNFHIVYINYGSSGVSNTSVQSSQIGTDCTTGQKVTSWLNLIFCNEFATIISFLRLSRRVSYRYESEYFG